MDPSVKSNITEIEGSHDCADAPERVPETPKEALSDVDEKNKKEAATILEPNTIERLQDQLKSTTFFEEEKQIHPASIGRSAEDVAPRKTPPIIGEEEKAGVSSEEKASANMILIKTVELKSIGENTLRPREQEKEDEAVLRGLHHLFNNRFMSAKTFFEKRSNRDPLYALALSLMAFLKAVMTSAEQDQTMALDALNATFSIANAQIDAAKKPPTKVSDYFSGYFRSKTSSSGSQQECPSNGVLRAHVIKAECCLLIAIIQLLQESVMSYIKCGFNLRRAYSSYSFVWKTYKALGSDYLAYMDSDTVSGVQFGIGSVHLVLSALPAKVLRAISTLGWKPDKPLGFSLLNACAAAKRVRSPMATLMLLAYYSTATSFAPQILSEAYSKIAMEILLEAQSLYPNSALYLFFAGKISRLAKDLPLSTQSFLYASEMSKGDWAEVAVANTCSYEIALNHMITGNWEQAASEFQRLCERKYWSAAFCKYLEGACLEMTGKNRTEAILAFAQVPSLVMEKKNTLGSQMSSMDSFALRKVRTYQESGYQDLDLYAPALEFLCIWNLYALMPQKVLADCGRKVEAALQSIEKREQEEYEIRARELAPDTPLPDHFDKRAILLLIKAAIQNAAGDPGENNTIILNWIIDHKDSFVKDSWVIPYALWEAGVACWKTDRRNRSRHVWDMALNYSKYDFEYRLTVRLNLAIQRAEELGYADPIAQPVDDKKRFSISLQAMMNSKPDS